MLYARTNIVWHQSFTSHVYSVHTTQGVSGCHHGPKVPPWLATRFHHWYLYNFLLTPWAHIILSDLKQLVAMIMLKVIVIALS